VQRSVSPRPGYVCFAPSLTSPRDEISRGPCVATLRRAPTVLQLSWPLTESGAEPPSPRGSAALNDLPTDGTMAQALAGRTRAGAPGGARGPDGNDRPGGAVRTVQNVRALAKSAGRAARSGRLRLAPRARLKTWPVAMPQQNANTCGRVAVGEPAGRGSAMPAAFGNRACLCEGDRHRRGSARLGVARAAGRHRFRRRRPRLAWRGLAALRPAAPSGRCPSPEFRVVTERLAAEFPRRHGRDQPGAPSNAAASTLARRGVAPAPHAECTVPARALAAVRATFRREFAELKFLSPARRQVARTEL